MNPHGNPPVHPLATHALMDTHDRCQYPAIACSLEFDSDCDRRVDSWTPAARARPSAPIWVSTLQLSLRFSAPHALLFDLDWVWRSADARLTQSFPLTHV